ncbi:type IV secretion system DNA-binding domain-containing protein [Acinetobacter sp. 187]|uniref:type IV secretory system conjugative DNA transfer family protein n=1 Tax=Acinetobacter lanii TaxID=2715163 RepID=UPI0014077B5A|nr:type IV secretory system conjugative DNA transfer family protein [Acinetobacter lanii]NHC05030.1 type IV secretion system DNA-binding domain-containing protein [Acinetobacter lanii]
MSVYIDRLFIPKFERLLKSGTQKAGTQRDSKTDIRDIHNSFKSVLEYDPQKFFSSGKWFFGLDMQRKPIYYDKEKLVHTQITGPSGFGKSVQLGVLSFQAILKREATIIFDPKHGGDEWFPHICYTAAQSLNVPYFFVDLRANLAQLNLFTGMTSDQIINLLIVGLLLEERGDAADYYRAKNRKMARFVGKNYREGMTLKEISKTYDEYFRKNEADGFADALQELAEVVSVNAIEGISLQDAVDQGHVIYVAGDWEDPKHITVQRMLLARIVQIVSQRDNTLETPKQVCIILDELSFQISKIFGDALKVIRDKGLHFILAHQSINDLLDVPDNMNGKTLASSVMANCPLKFTYRAVDNETAQYFAEFSGEILVDDEARNIEKTLSLTDRVTGEKQIRQTERNLIDFNTMLSLPSGTGVLFGNGTAQISVVSPIKVKKTADAKKLTNTDNTKLDKKSDVSNILIFKDLD